MTLSVGDRVRYVYDFNRNVPCGTLGTIREIGDTSVWVDWDNGAFRRNNSEYCVSFATQSDPEEYKDDFL